jgi:hypothetical protein
MQYTLRLNSNAIASLVSNTYLEEREKEKKTVSLSDKKMLYAMFYKARALAQ